MSTVDTRLPWGGHDSLVAEFTDVANVDTQLTREVRDALDAAVTARRILIVYGRVGLGKSFSVAKACECYSEHTPGGVHVSYFRLAGAGRDRALYQMVFKKLAGLTPPASWSAIELREAITHELRDRERILVFDEAHRLSVQAQQAIQEMSDTPGRRCGIVLMGGETTPKKLLPELESRSWATIAVERIDDASVPALLKPYHPILERTSDAMLVGINRQITRGEWRRWCKLVGRAAQYGLVDGITRAISRRSESSDGHHRSPRHQAARHSTESADHRARRHQASDRARTVVHPVR